MNQLSQTPKNVSQLLGNLYSSNSIRTVLMIVALFALQQKSTAQGTQLSPDVSTTSLHPDSLTQTIISSKEYDSVLPVSIKKLTKDLESDLMSTNLREIIPTLSQEVKDKFDIQYIQSYTLQESSLGYLLIVISKQGEKVQGYINTQGGVYTVVAIDEFGDEITTDYSYNFHPNTAIQDTIQQSTKGSDGTLQSISSNQAEPNQSPTTYSQPVANVSIINGETDFGEPAVSSSESSGLYKIPETAESRDTRSSQIRIDELLGSGMYPKFRNTLIKEASNEGIAITESELQNTQVFKTPDGYGSITLTRPYTSEKSGKRFVSFSMLFNEDGIHSINGEGVTKGKAPDIYGSIEEVPQAYQQPPQSTPTAPQDDDVASKQSYPNAQPWLQEKQEQVQSPGQLNTSSMTPEEVRTYVTQSFKNSGEQIEEINSLKLGDFIPAGQKKNMLLQAQQLVVNAEIVYDEKIMLSSPASLDSQTGIVSVTYKGTNFDGHPRDVIIKLIIGSTNQSNNTQTPQLYNARPLTGSPYAPVLEKEIVPNSYTQQLQSSATQYINVNKVETLGYVGDKGIYSIMRKKGYSDAQTKQLDASFRSVVYDFLPGNITQKKLPTGGYEYSFNARILNGNEKIDGPVAVRITKEGVPILFR